MSEESVRTRRTYDRIAGAFLANTRDRFPMQAALDEFRERLAGGAVVLDVGAGPGADSAELRARGLRAVTVDLSLGMLKEGAGFFPGPRVQADMRRLPFGSVADGIWANASLLHLPRAEVPAILRELARVLRPEGLLYLSVKEGTGEGYEEERYGAGNPRFFTYWGPEALDAALAAGGFGIERARSTRGPRDRWLQRIARRR